MSTFWKKLLISILGLVIISIFVCRIFEETVQEGFPDVVVNIANAAANRVAQLTGFIQRITASIKQGLISAKDTIQRKAIEARRRLETRIRNARNQAIDRAARAAKEMRDRARSAYANIQRNYLFGMGTAQRVKMVSWQGLLNIYNWMKLLTIIGMLIILGGYLWEVMVWFVNSVICSFRFITLFNSCAFWYILDIISWIVYLIYSFPFWLLDQLISRNVDADEMDDNFFQNIFVKSLMELLDEFDCIFFEVFGFYLIHFKRNVMKKCFVCEMPKFPPFPDLFDKDGIKKAYNKYGLGSIPFLKA
tara:strand:+ start:4856 stop:5770 length:915 start_codon:yes stop_codon:yes gene_type:complete